MGPHTLMAGCVARTPFRTQVECAAKAGFAAMTIWPSVWRHAIGKCGYSFHDMRAMLDDHGIRLEQVEGVREWPPGEAAIEACAALGGKTIVAMRLDTSPFDPHEEADSFAAFAERARAFGVRPAIEFVAFGGIRDAAGAWQLLELSGCEDAGLVVDIAHHRRSGGSDKTLFAIPPQRIVSVQLADGPATPPADLVAEATWGRMWPGEGAFGVAEFVSRLQAHGVEAAIGVELYRREFEEMAAEEVIAALAKAGKPFLAKSA